MKCKAGVSNRKSVISGQNKVSFILSLALVSLYENKVWVSGMNIWVESNERASKIKNDILK